MSQVVERTVAINLNKPPITAATPANIAVRESGAPNDFLAYARAIEAVATNPELDVAKLERLLQMQNDQLTRSAEVAFNAAMTKAQSEMKLVATNANNPTTHSKYATYSALDKMVRPIYTQNGFALSFNTGDEAPPECVRILCDVSHSAGFTRQYKVDMPADGKGAKGGDVMTKTHATGAAMSYGMRYLLKMIFNVAVGEDDTDGNAPEITRISAKQVADLQKLIDEVKQNKDRFCRYYKIKTLSELPANVFTQAMNGLKQKKAVA